MKFCAPLIITSLLIAAIPSAAQEAATESTPATTAERKHDISIFSQYGGSFTNQGNFDVHGAVYRWAKPRNTQTFWKLGAGVGSSFEITWQSTQLISADSALDIELHRDERVYMMLGGVETQRHLWRGVFLTAGLEAQAGGSGGGLDSVNRRTFNHNDPQSGQPIGPPARLADTRRFFGTGLALLGARIYAGRITCALDLFTGFQIAAQSENRTGSNTTIMDFSLGGSGGRFSVGYRF